MQAQINSQAITSFQSQDLIKDLITISLHCITFLRNIFDDDNFIDKKFIPDSLNKKGNSVKTKQLVKGISKEADLFINWIEKGIYDSINLKYLKAIQFAIFLDETNPLNISESYLFKFDYDLDDIFISVNNKLQKKLTNLSAREKVQQLIKRLIVLTQTFNPLPEKKLISIRLLYNENCPIDYQPPFFKDATNLEAPTIDVDKQNLNNADDDIGTINTGYNSINIKILTTLGKEVLNPIKIDPFDLIFNELIFDNKEFSNQIDFPESVNDEDLLALDKFLEPMNKKIDSTQLLPPTIQEDPVNTILDSKTCECKAPLYKSILILTCESCSRKIHACCYGIMAAIKKITCYTCYFKELDSYLIILMRSRYLWKHFSSNGIPSLSEIFDNFRLVRDKDEDNLRVIFNKFFKDNILVTTNEPILKKNGDLLIGSGYLIPNFNGIIDNNGKQLQLNEKYAIAFVPRVKTYVKSLSYNLSIKSIYFPGLLNNIESIKENLKKFKDGLINNAEEESINSSSLSFNNNSIDELPIKNLSLINNSTSSSMNNNSSIDQIDSLSFEDSLNFLSQSQKNCDSLPFTNNKKRTIENNVNKASVKHRKISVNKDRLF